MWPEHIFMVLVSNSSIQESGLGEKMQEWTSSLYAWLFWTYSKAFKDFIKEQT